MSAILAFLLTALLVPLVMRLKIMDNPNYRSIHLQATPKAGGIAILGGLLAGTLLNGWALEYWALGLLFIASAALGLFDDLKNISPRVKLFGQFLLALATVLLGYSFQLLGNFGDYVLTLLWIIGYMNAFNLIDGLDGLAGGLTVISALAFLFLGIPGFSLFLLPLSGALIAFLLYNFKPAKIFMGDTGSMFLGYLLAVAGVMAQSGGSLKIPAFLGILLILYYPLFDLVLSIIRRRLHKKPIFAPDRSHSYNLLTDQLGLSYLGTVLSIYFFSLLTAFLGILTYKYLSWFGSIILFILVALSLVFPVLRFKLLAESKLEKSQKEDSSWRKKTWS